MNGEKVRALKEISDHSEERVIEGGRRSRESGENCAQVSVRPSPGCEDIRFQCYMFAPPFDNSPVSLENKNLLGGSM